MKPCFGELWKFGSTPNSAAEDIKEESTKFKPLNKAKTLGKLTANISKITNRVGKEACPMNIFTFISMVSYTLAAICSDLDLTA